MRLGARTAGVCQRWRNRRVLRESQNHYCALRLIGIPICPQDSLVIGWKLFFVVYSRAIQPFRVEILQGNLAPLLSLEQRMKGIYIRQDQSKFPLTSAPGGGHNPACLLS